MKLILQGVDPGIVDTGMVTMTFDFPQRQLTTLGRVWSGVATRRGHSLQVSQHFLKEIAAASVADNPKGADYARYTYIEGFRNRGRDTYQDQTMTVLVQEIQRALLGLIVDNTGVKKVVTTPLVQLLQVARWPRTNHADLLSASRIALKGAIEDPALNPLLAAFVKEQHQEKNWQITTTLIDPK